MPRKTVLEKIKKSFEGFEERRQVQLARRIKNNEVTKEWKKKEELIKKGLLPEPRRRDYSGGRVQLNRSKQTK